MRTFLVSYHISGDGVVSTFGNSDLTTYEQKITISVIREWERLITEFLNSELEKQKFENNVSQVTIVNFVQLDQE